LSNSYLRCDRCDRVWHFFNLFLRSVPWEYFIFCVKPVTPVTPQVVRLFIVLQCSLYVLSSANAIVVPNRTLRLRLGFWIKFHWTEWSLRVWRRRPGRIHNRWGGGGHSKSEKHETQRSAYSFALFPSLYLSVVSSFGGPRARLAQWPLAELLLSCVAIANGLRSLPRFSTRRKPNVRLNGQQRICIYICLITLSLLPNYHEYCSGAPRHDQRSFLICFFLERRKECEVSEEARKGSVMRSTWHREVTHGTRHWA